MTSDSEKTVLLSGGFDPVHVGHVRMIRAASELGRVVVAVNSDDWLMRKKGYIFMPWPERTEILRAILGVAEVVAVEDDDGTVCEVLKKLQPDIFGNGGDRTNKNTPEKATCQELGIKMIWALGGKKIQSSSELVSESNLVSTLPTDPDIPQPDRVLILRGLKGKDCEN